MWPAFFARVRPVTRNAKPTCMKSTRKPVSSNHVRLIEMPRWPVCVASVCMPACETGTFVTPGASGLLASTEPVFVPPGSAWWLN